MARRGADVMSMSGRSTAADGRVARAAGAQPVIAVRRRGQTHAPAAGPVVALEAIDFAVADGEFIAVLGPSGCGKSTLLKILAGLFPPSGGEAALRGTAITGPRRDIGVVFQSPVLFPWRSVLQNVLLPADVQRLGRAQHERKALGLLSVVGLVRLAARHPLELSGGLQHHVPIVPGLIPAP